MKFKYTMTFQVKRDLNFSAEVLEQHRDLLLNCFGQNQFLVNENGATVGHRAGVGVREAKAGVKLVPLRCEAGEIVGQSFTIVLFTDAPLSQENLKWFFPHVLGGQANLHMKYDCVRAQGELNPDHVEKLDHVGAPGMRR